MRPTITAARRPLPSAPRLALAVLALAALASAPAPAAEPPAAPAPASGGLHPSFRLRDAAGAPLTAADLQGGVRVSARSTCGACHDADFIAAHDAHGAAAGSPEARARLAAKSIDCFTCHVPGGAQTLIDTLDAAGSVRLQMGPPAAAACGQCHGAVFGAADPVLFVPDQYLAGEPYGPYGQTQATGTVFAPQPVASSFLNLADKEARSQPWDVHAARGLSCASCHVAPNDPASAGLVGGTGQRHLVRDPRRLTADAFLTRPDHQLVTAACSSCHDPVVAHPNLPSRARHLEALACQACHVPQVAAPTPSVIDRTVVTAAGGPRFELRGVTEREWDDQPSTWFSRGYRPFLLPEPAAGAAPEAPARPARLAPYNVRAEWLWIDRGRGDAPVPAEQVRRAWLDDAGRHRAELVPLFDRDGDGRLAGDELVLDRDDRVAAIRARLVAAGALDPVIAGRLETLPVRHGVVDGKGALTDCQACHARDSRLLAAIPVTDGPLPGGVAPVPDAAARVRLGARRLQTPAGGGLLVSASPPPPDRYVLGQARPWSDALGLLIFAGTLLGIALHGGLRYRAASRAGGHAAAPTARVYMYGAYERVWHWLMASSVLLLLVTGLRIHFGAHVPLLPYPTSVFLHDAVAIVFVINAFLSLFYHVTTAEIRQFIPARAGLVSRVLLQVRYYLRGIFARAAHPLAKTPQAKLNPLQQVTYFGLLNVLFPLQIATGLLMWAGGRWPDALGPLGGLAMVAPVHNLGSWLLLTFLVMHVYLTTTGHTLTSNLKAMVDGWDEVEAEAAVPVPGAPAARGGVEYV